MGSFTVKRVSFILLLLFPLILKECNSELRSPETWFVGRSHRSNFSFPIILDRNETTTKERKYTTFVIPPKSNTTATSKMAEGHSIAKERTLLSQMLDPNAFEEMEASFDEISLSLNDTKKVPDNETFTAGNVTVETYIKNEREDEKLLDGQNMLENALLNSPNEDLEDVEETFTYQVKRRKKLSFAKDGLTDFIDLLKKSKAYKTEDEQVNKVVDQRQEMDQLQAKLQGLIQHLEELEQNASISSSSHNSRIKELQHQAQLMSENYLRNQNSTQELQNTIKNERSRIEGQMNALGTQVKLLTNSTDKKLQSLSVGMKHLNSTIENMSHEVRMNEMKIRFNQKALTSLDRNVQSNNEKLMDLSSLAGPKWVEQTTGCGGLLIGESGLLSYKYRQQYYNNERCVWTFRADRRARIVLQLLDDGFQNTSNSDFLTITEFTDDMGLITSSRIEHGNKATHNFKGPILFITFYSDSSTTGTGFSLKFQGQGNNSLPQSLNAQRFAHFHLKEPSGTLSHPMEKGLTYQPNEVATFVLNSPQPGKTPRVHVLYTDMEKEENCEYDSANFYGSVKGSYALAKKYCDQQKTYGAEFLQSSDGTFIVIFRSDGSTQFKGFQFSWDSL